MLKLTTFGGPPNATPTPPPPPPPPPPLRLRTMKISGSDWLGNIAEENNRLSYAVANGINHIQLYGLYTVFDSSTLTDYLKLFIQRARSAPYSLFSVGAIMGSGTHGFDLALTYNGSVPTIQQFDDINKECEFWRYPAAGTETFANWIASMNYLYPLLNHTTQRASAYVQNYAAPVWGAPEAAQMVAVIDVYEATNYNDEPDEAEAMDTQLELIGNAAQAAGKVQKFQQLWSAEPGFMGPYLGTNGMTTAEGVWNADYAADGFINKSSLDHIGANYFTYRWLRTVIP